MGCRIHLKLCLVFMMFTYATASLIFGGVGAQQDQRPATPPAQQEDKPAEQGYKNIQVMKGAPAQRLLPAMNRLKQFHGDVSAYRHVPDDNDNNDKPPRKTSRKMINVKLTINH